MIIYNSIDDHSRVVLSLLEDDPNSDYINASYVMVIQLDIIIIIISKYQPRWCLK